VGVKDRVVGAVSGVGAAGLKVVGLKDKIKAPSLSNLVPDSLTGYLGFLAYWKYIALGLVFLIIVTMIWNSGVLEKFDEFLEEEDEERPAKKKEVKKEVKKPTKKTKKTTRKR